MSRLSNVTGPCDAGYFCVEGAAVADPKDNITGGICPKGHYCPAGTYDPQKCPQGSYSNSTGNRNISGCQPCMPGHYCDARGLGFPSGLCDPGFYCPGGQKSPTPSDYICSPGHACPAGSVQEEACESGTYQDEHQKSTCKRCPEGYYCDGTILNATHCTHGVQFPTPCRVGHYCPNGTKYAQEFKCPPGKVCPVRFLTIGVNMEENVTTWYSTEMRSTVLKCEVIRNDMLLGMGSFTLDICQLLETTTRI